MDGTSYSVAELKREANFVECPCPENPPHKFKLTDYGVNVGASHPYLWAVKECTKHHFQHTGTVAI